jgi:hypothetical protein
MTAKTKPAEGIPFITTIKLDAPQLILFPPFCQPADQGAVL